MPSVRAHAIAFAHLDSAPLFSESTFHLAPGWTGLVGANGAGKTTLLRLLTGELRPTGGHVQLEPAEARVALCEQEVAQLPDGVRALAERGDGEAARMRSELRLWPEELLRWETLSPGERKRWQIAAAVADAPEVLLLDEPTNHLDAAGRAWLVGALRRFAGVGLLVSHDRTLLDAVTSATLRLDGGALRAWPGPYSRARQAWEADRAAQVKRKAAATTERKRVERRLGDARRAQAGAVAQRSAGARMRNRKDSDARSLMADFRAEQAEKTLGRGVEVLRRSAERARSKEAALSIERELGGAVFVDWVAPPVAQLLVTREPVPGRAGLLVLGREDRIHLRGDNGAGKTTLLRKLLAGSRVAPERILHLPQELSPEEAAGILASVRALAPAERGRILSFVAALGVEPSRLLSSERPSPGEARKLLLARGLAEQAWALVLDEPTNHLDLPSIERLQAALAAYPGALLLVTHDEARAQACTTSSWELAGGRLRG